MTVSVILEGTLKDGEIEKFTGICKEAFEVTIGSLQKSGILSNIMRNIYNSEPKTEL